MEGFGMSITAMRQALKALEDLQHDLTKPLDGYHEQSGRAITALRAAIEQAEKRQWVGLTEKDFSAINQSCLTKLQAATSAESILKEKNHER
jgi:hypothetical protein